MILAEKIQLADVHRIASYWSDDTLFHGVGIPSHDLFNLSESELNSHLFGGELKGVRDLDILISHVEKRQCQTLERLLR